MAVFAVAHATLPIVVAGLLGIASAALANFMLGDRFVYPVAPASRRHRQPADPDTGEARPTAALSVGLARSRQPRRARATATAQTTPRSLVPSQGGGLGVSPEIPLPEAGCGWPKPEKVA